MIKFNSKAVKAKLKETVKYVEKKIPDRIEKLALLINASMKNRVQTKGLGTSGKMKKYTPRYEKWKKKKKRGIRKRDLTFTGTMWDSLTVMQSGKKTKLFFSGKEENIKAKAHQKTDEFFGLAKPEQKIIDKELAQIMKEVI